MKLIYQVVNETGSQYLCVPPRRFDSVTLLGEVKGACVRVRFGKVLPSEALLGHETTAHTLVWALNHMALYPELQEKAYKDVVEVLGETRNPDYEDYKHLGPIEAIMRETLRLCPAVTHIPKVLTCRHAILLVSAV